ncbi:MAG TPA: xanthine dehydrogenase, partial [Candidatus Cloacimonadota bacterium]|nr:xanthine dehydrogenase [Candidatus Cloacimonadota bacterium]
TAKRKSVDISSVASAIRIQGESVILALGGVAATPVISSVFSSSVPLMDGKAWQAVAQAVAEEFSPLSDVRGSADYRRKMIINHILQYAEEYHG